MIRSAVRAVRVAAVLVVLGVCAVLPVESVGSAPAAASTTAPAARAPGTVDVNDVLLVVNDDGSATLSASLLNHGDTELALLGVRIAQDGQELPVASTLMLLPLPPEIEARIGDASDAGGFVVPDGVRAGVPVTVELALDDGRVIDVEPTVVRRSRAHDTIFPDNGSQLGPGA